MRPPRVPAPKRHDPTHLLPDPPGLSRDLPDRERNHDRERTHDRECNHDRVARPARASVTLGLALLANTPLLMAPIACASSPGTAPAPAHRNNAERPPPFAIAPDFTVTDATGVPRDLASLMGPKGLVLVLYRGHW
jgi:hypothetical protein